MIEKISYRIADARRTAGLTQQQVADELGVSFQAVSSWETGRFIPDTENLIRLAKLLDVSLSSLAEDSEPFAFELVKDIFNWEHMRTFIKATAKANSMNNTLNALDFAIMAHEGQKKKKSDIPFVYHPLTLACHCLAMGIQDDSIVAACLLHDVIEDTEYDYCDLPVGEETKRLVELMTQEKDDSRRKEILDAYFEGLKSDPKAALIKCLDRCNNLTTMSWGLKRERIYRMVNETEVYVYPLLAVIKAQPEYNNAAWLLSYQIRSMIDIYKRLM